MSKSFVTIASLIMMLVGLAMISCNVVRYINFNRHCIGHLKRAANANTISIAAKELKTVIDYAEAHNLTNGYTSVFYKTPDEDIEFWYNNLTNAYAELLNLPDDIDALTATNVLLKLRESITDQDSSGSNAVKPTGLAYYPHNLGYGLMLFFGILCTIFFGILFFVIITD